MTAQKTIPSINKNATNVTESLNALPHWKSHYKNGKKFNNADKYLFGNVRYELEQAVTYILGRPVCTVMRMNDDHCSFIIRTRGNDVERKVVLVIKPGTEKCPGGPAYPVMVMTGCNYGPVRLELTPDNTPRVFWFVLGGLDEEITITPGTGLAPIVKQR